MNKIDIIRLYSEYECEDCGCSSAFGAIVKIGGKEVMRLDPSAHCFGGTDYSDEQILEKVLEHLGYTVEYKD